MASPVLSKCVHKTNLTPFAKVGEPLILQGVAFFPPAIIINSEIVPDVINILINEISTDPYVNTPAEPVLVYFDIDMSSVTVGGISVIIDGSPVLSFTSSEEHNYNRFPVNTSISFLRDNLYTVSATKETFTHSSEPSKKLGNIAGDGTKLYLATDLNSTYLGLHQYTLSVPGDITTAVLDAEISLPVAYRMQMCFDVTGTRLYVSSWSPGRIYQFSLSTPWDISTYTLINEKVFSPNNVRSMALSTDGAKMFISRIIQVGAATLLYLYEMTLSTPFDITTLVDTDKYIVLGASQGAYVTENIIFVHTAGIGIARVDMPTSWDIDSAYDPSQEVTDYSASSISVFGFGLNKIYNTTGSETYQRDLYSTFTGSANVSLEETPSGTIINSDSAVTIVNNEGF